MGERVGRDVYTGTRRLLWGNTFGAILALGDVALDLIGEAVEPDKETQLKNREKDQFRVSLNLNGQTYTFTIL